MYMYSSIRLKSLQLALLSTAHCSFVAETDTLFLRMIDRSTIFLSISKVDEYGQSCTVTLCTCNDYNRVP